MNEPETTDSVRAEIDRIRGDASHPWHNASDPRHQEAVEYFNGLYKNLHGEQVVPTDCAAAREEINAQLSDPSGVIHRDPAVKDELYKLAYPRESPAPLPPSFTVPAGLHEGQVRAQWEGWAQDVGVSQRDFETLLARMAHHLQKGRRSETEKAAAEYATAEVLEREWGGDLDRRVSAAQWLVRHFLPRDMKEELRATGADSDPVIVRLAEKYAQKRLPAYEEYRRLWQEQAKSGISSPAGSAAIEAAARKAFGPPR